MKDTIALPIEIKIQPLHQRQPKLQSFFTSFACNKFPSVIFICQRELSQIES